jgi:hypothetical protein
MNCDFNFLLVKKRYGCGVGDSFSCGASLEMVVG